MVFEIYSHLGNTDKRRLRQTSTKYNMKFKEKNKLEELIEDGYDIDEKYYPHVIHWVIQYGRLDIVKKVKIYNLCDVTASYGQLNILIWAHENGHSWSESTCRHAARGHLTCLKYLHENGCPWDKDACCAAAQGHL